MASRSATMSGMSAKRAMVILSSPWSEARAFVAAALWCFSGSVRLAASVVLGAELGELSHQVLHQIRGVAHMKEELDTREVHATHLCEVADDAHALQIVVGVEADVRLGPHRFEQAFLLVNPQRPRMAARETGRDGDDVHRSVTTCHVTCIKPTNIAVKVLTTSATG